MNPTEILAAAKAAPIKVQIEEYRDAVNVLRDKGYSWREIAEFLNKQGVQTDHTRIYRTFGNKQVHRPTETRNIQIEKITYLGTRQSKKRNSWNVMELELPSKLGKSLTVVGYAWGTGNLITLQNGDNIAHRNASLVIKSGDKYPLAYIKLELKLNDNNWSSYEVYITPKWEKLI